MDRRSNNQERKRKMCKNRVKKSRVSYGLQNLMRLTRSRVRLRLDWESDENKDGIDVLLGANDVMLIEAKEKAESSIPMLLPPLRSRQMISKLKRRGKHEGQDKWRDSREISQLLWINPSLSNKLYWAIIKGPHMRLWKHCWQSLGNHDKSERGSY